MKLSKTLIIIVFILLLLPICVTAATRDEALAAIRAAEIDVEQMALDGFNIKAVNDSLFAAEKALERADFAAVLKEGNGELVEQARVALEGLNYEGFSYNDVLKYTDQITKRKNQAYEVRDGISAAENKIRSYSIEGVDVEYAEELLVSAKEAFEKERYNEAATDLADLNNNLETRRAELSAVRIVAHSSKNFVVEHWKELLIVLAGLILIGILFAHRIYLWSINKKLRKLLLEHEALLQLMKQNQVERFRDGSIPKSIYEIRMEKYNERLNTIKELIPVYESMLHKDKKKAKAARKSFRQNKRAEKDHSKFYKDQLKKEDKIAKKISKKKWKDIKKQSR